MKLCVDGREISSNEYLESCLKDNDTNVICQTIRNYFKERHCFVFPHPASNDKLSNLDKMKMSELDPYFVLAGNKFTEFVMQRSRPKIVRGKALTGTMYATLAEKYVEAIINGNVNIETAYESMISMQNSKSTAAALESYKEEMNMLKLPVEMDTLNAASAKAQKTASEIFLKTAVNTQRNNVNYFEEMTAQLYKILKDITQKNWSKSNEVCKKMLEKLYAPIDSRVGKGEFTRAGGHQAYKQEVEKMEEDYKKLPNSEKGPCGEKALMNFLQEKV